MTALEEYERAKLLHGFKLIVEPADAAIAELQADLHATQGVLEAAIKRYQEAEHLLAEREGQRCYRCASVQHYTFDKKPVMCCRHPQSPFLECDVPIGFYCALYQPRPEGGEE